jgi:hypothetical protein
MAGLYWIGMFPLLAASRTVTNYHLIVWSLLCVRSVVDASWVQGGLYDQWPFLCRLFRVGSVVDACLVQGGLYDQWPFLRHLQASLVEGVIMEAGP